MRKRRKFSLAFKRGVVEEMLSRGSTLGRLSRRLDVSSGLILRRKKRYETGGLPGIPSKRHWHIRHGWSRIKDSISHISNLWLLIQRIVCPLSISATG